MSTATDSRTEALHQRYQKYAVKFVLDAAPGEEPTDANLTRVLGRCVRRRTSRSTRPYGCTSTPTAWRRCPPSTRHGTSWPIWRTGTSPTPLPWTRT